MARELTTQDFDQVIGGDRPVLVDFWATWCPPCRAIAPTIDALAERFDGEAIVAKVDVDSNAELAQRYGVQSIPTILIFSGGEPVERLVGVQSEERLAEAIENATKARA